MIRFLEEGTSVLQGVYGAGRQGSGSSLGEGCVSVLGHTCLMGEFIHRTHAQCEPLPQLGLVSSRSATLYFTIIKEQASRLLQGEGMFVSCAVSGGTRGPLLLKHTLSVVLCWCRFRSLSQEGASAAYPERLASWARSLGAPQFSPPGSASGSLGLAELGNSDSPIRFR